MKLKGEYRPLAFPCSMIYLEKREVRGAYTMAKSENQKVKTLFVAKYFLENSDENHPITAGAIVDYLREECGIEVERRAIYRDIAALRDVYGMDIAGGQGGKYRLLSRQFEFEDLRLLAECVHAAKFISASKAKELVQTISEFCSIYQAEELQREVFLCDCWHYPCGYGYQAGRKATHTAKNHLQIFEIYTSKQERTGGAPQRGHL